MTTPRTLIHAGHVIAFDGRGHRLLRDGAVVLEGDRIVHVGPRAGYREPVDTTVDARDRVLTPGLISTHAHIAGSPLDRSFIEDTGRPQFYYSGLFETLPVRDGAQEQIYTSVVRLIQEQLKASVSTHEQARHIDPDDVGGI